MFSPSYYTNNSIRKKQHPNHFLFVSATSTKQPINDGGGLIVVRYIIILL